MNKEKTKEEPKYGPLWQLKQQIEHYTQCGISFTQDADRAHKKAEEAFAMAEKYKEAVDALETHLKDKDCNQPKE